MTDRESDRELLELAAKAAGYEFGEINGTFKARIEQDFGTCGTYGCQKHQWRDWNPLTDDGDALRLAVKVGMNLALVVLAGFSVAAAHFSEQGVPKSEVVEPHGDDPYAATRRAIVRAAAEIGRQHD